MRDNVWSPDFERYEALLEIGRDFGRAARFLDLENSSLPYTTRILHVNGRALRCRDWLGSSISHPA